jgi:SAM-dependent methyltransferase
MPFCMIDLTCSRVFLRRPFAFSSGRRGSPSGCDSSDAHEFFGIDDPAVRGDQTVCDLDCVDGVDPAFPVEHEGELAAYLGEVNAVRTTGLDINPGMVQVARSLPSELPISWQAGSALRMPFPDEYFDVVLCQQGVQFFPDRAAGLREMRRVLAPGGRVVLAVSGLLT